MDKKAAQGLTNQGPSSVCLAGECLFWLSPYGLFIGLISVSSAHGHTGNANKIILYPKSEPIVSLPNVIL